MGYKCKYCGYTLPEKSYHRTAEDIELILKHDKECKQKPINKAINED